MDFSCESATNLWSSQSRRNEAQDKSPILTLRVNRVEGLNAQVPHSGFMLFLDLLPITFYALQFLILPPMDTVLLYLYAHINNCNLLCPRNNNPFSSLLIRPPSRNLLQPPGSWHLNSRVLPRIGPLLQFLNQCFTKILPCSWWFVPIHKA